MSGADFENGSTVIREPLHRGPMPSLKSISARRLLLPSILLSLATGSMAQTARAAGQPDLPSKLQYVSPIQAYKAYADQPVESWREANDRVGRIGGWRTYAKEMRTGEPAKDSAPPTDPHTGHDKGAKP